MVASLLACRDLNHAGHIIALAVVFSPTISIAQTSPTVGSLIAKGGKVESVVTSQDYPYFVVSSPDGKVYFCALSVDEAYKFFDYRQPNPPASIGSRCSELK
jgi:hypothetical protein